MRHAQCMTSVRAEPRSALIVAVPEAEPAVAAHRERLDRATRWGIPAHVTVLYPFLPPHDLDQRVAAVLAAVAAREPAFDLTLRLITGREDDGSTWSTVEEFA